MCKSAHVKDTWYVMPCYAMCTLVGYRFYLSIKFHCQSPLGTFKMNYGTWNKMSYGNK